MLLQSNNSTIFLLDLLTPDNVSALDYLNVLPRIRNLADSRYSWLTCYWREWRINQVIPKLILASDGKTETYHDEYKIWKLSNDLANIRYRNNSNLYLLWNYCNEVESLI